jgi:hypothetical protein
MKNLLLICLLNAASLYAFGQRQQDLLDSLMQRSEIIVHLEVDEVQSGLSSLGATTYSIKGTILTLYKGEPKGFDSIEFEETQSVGTKFTKLEKGKDYIVFLHKAPYVIKPKNHNIYTSTDYWFGVQTYSDQLNTVLAK